MNSKLSTAARIVSVVCAVALTVSIFTPLWRIDLTAPQYPEGLGLKIYPNKLGGDADIINGLNHYIGMRPLHAKDFFEFTILPYLIGIFSFFGFLSAMINRRWFFYTWVILFILFGIVAMFDFYRWEYNYGHNLDPAAAIIVPGMSYEPPLIGYKKLLNFGAWSFPDIGGYIFIVVGLLLVISVFTEWRKMAKQNKLIKAALFISSLLLLQSCSTGPQPIAYGKDGCHFCKMVISDQRFGAEVITDKNKIYKFDDTHCAVSFLKSNSLKPEEIAAVYLADFSKQGSLIKAGDCFLFASEELKSPMGGNVAAFTAEDSMKKYRQQMNGIILNWNQIIQ
jgi:copper chaperone NosL